jgi:6-phosphogluconolactonase (cycloisomerase 2 family)
MTQSLRPLSYIGTFAALLLATGCSDFFPPVSLSSGSGGSSGTDYVYVANATTGDVAAYSVASGALTAVSGSPFSLGFTPSAIVVNPANSIVFVAGTSGGTGFINAYSIGTGGVLKLLQSNSVGLASPVSMEVSPDGQWLIGLDANGLSIDEYSINSTSGQLTLASGATYAVSGATVVPRAIKISPNAAYVFVALGTAGDLVFAFNTTTGVLTSSQQLKIGTNESDNALAVSPATSYLYIARSGTNGGLAVYSIGSGGALTAISGSPFAAGSQPFSVVINSGGTDVYVANQLDSTISGYSISSTKGGLTALSGSPYTNSSEPTVLAIDNTGKYLLAASHAGSPDLSLYSFDSTVTGKLDYIASTSTGKDPTGPIAMAVTH